MSSEIEEELRKAKRLEGVRSHARALDGKTSVVFLVALGVVLFLAGAVYEGLFYTPLPLAENFCLEWIERDNGEVVCFKCLNEFEANKYFHNRREKRKLKYRAYGSMAVAAFFSLAYFLLVPWRKMHPKPRGDSRAGWFLGVAAGGAFFGGVIVPLILGMLLPPAGDWLPERFQEMARDRQLREIEFYREMAEEEASDY